jgi:uncharacterized protein (TIGR02301 family)
MPRKGRRGRDLCLAAAQIFRHNNHMAGKERILAVWASIVLATASAVPARAVDAPYDADLMRLAELLGSLHYLRNLCGEKGTTWREQMEQLITTENPDADRRARLTASFNRGYRSFDSVYTTCTPSAVEAIERYMLEGETLTKQIVAKYGN